MDFKQLRSFVAVVRYGSFTTAAEKLFLSQPTISIHVRQLEEELNAQLVIRTTKNLEVTPKGKEIYEYASQILRLKARAEESCAQESVSNIHIGASTIPSCYILPQLLASYQKVCPDIQFHIHQSDSQGILDGLSQNIFDIGFVGMNSVDQELVTVPLWTDRMVLITPNNEKYRAIKEQGTDAVPDLRGESFISREEGSGSLRAVEHFMESFGIPFEELRVIARVNDCETIKNLTYCELGVSIISERAAKDFIDQKKILAFDLPKEIATRKLYIAYRNSYIMSPELKGFLKFLNC